VTDLTGYLHPGYAASLSEFGVPRELPHSGGWILERKIPGSEAKDAMGCYPIFACRDWTALDRDFKEIERKIVSLTLVADPFGNHSEQELRRLFPDVVLHFKDHFLVDLTGYSEKSMTKHHRYYMRRALREMTVEDCVDPARNLDEWLEFYGTLINRRHLRGVKAFSRAAFADQMRVPGLVMLRAAIRGTGVGAHLWYIHGDVAYSHLMACSEAGYKMMTAYALYGTSIEYFRGKVRWLELGSGSGTEKAGDAGLDFFKRGWANATRPVYLTSGGSILPDLSGRRIRVRQPSEKRRPRRREIR
jgi:hypothetical protein